MNDLRGLDLVVRHHRDKKRVRVGDRTSLRGMEYGGDTYSDGLQEASFELMGFDISTVTPYLSAFAGGFGGGGDAKKPDAGAEEIKKKQAELEKKQADEESHSRTVIWVIVGTVGVALAGTVAYLVGRK